jgi:hypothetical protein
MPPNLIFMKVRPLVKMLAVLLVAGGIGAIWFDSSQAAHIPLLVGLFMLLVTSDTVEDERSVQVKTSSLYIAFVLSYGFKLITTNLYQHELISFSFIEIDHFLILVLGLANGIFYGRLYVLRF